MQMPTLPYTSVAKRAADEEPIFPLMNVLGTITVSTFFSGTVERLPPL
jgi:hypothetical protein